MDNHRWVKEFSGAITVCDPQGIILEMNHQAEEMFQESGGKKLLGSNLYDCHPEPARTKLKYLMDKQQENIYTVEKNGIKRLIYQTPWYTNGEYCGFVEMALLLPESMPHFIRDRNSSTND
jgi:transcriptional regulator with PAS, ATPase and Fis domain